MNKKLITYIVAAVVVIAIMAVAAVQCFGADASSVTVDCGSCEGVGYCSDCYGKTVECETCEGLNVCADCSGSGTVAASSKMYSTFWALIPPVIAIGLALVTKEVYSSLFIGIVAGALIGSDFSFTGAVDMVISDGIISAVPTPRVFLFSLLFWAQ